MKKAEDTVFFFASVWTCKTDINPEYLINSLIIIFIDVTKPNFGYIKVATFKAGFENYFLSIKLSVKECMYFSSDNCVPQDADRMQLQLFFKERFWNIQCTQRNHILYLFAFHFFSTGLFSKFLLSKVHILEGGQEIRQNKPFSFDVILEGDFVKSLLPFLSNKKM